MSVGDDGAAVALAPRAVHGAGSDRRRVGLLPKDAGDVFRPYDANSVGDMLTRLGPVHTDERSAAVTSLAMGYLHTLFATPRSPGIALAVDALAQVVSGDDVTQTTVDYTRALLADAQGERPRNMTLSTPPTTAASTCDLSMGSLAASNNRLAGAAHWRRSQHRELTRLSSSPSATIVCMDSATTDRGDIRRVLVAGDTHGNTRWVRHLIDVAVQSECPVIVQVGDFGYFPDHRDGPGFLSTVDRACAESAVELWFIDGNHDDHASLASLEHGHVPVRVGEHITYLARGTRLHIGGRAIGFLGGAFSVDWRVRQAGIDWWPHEVTDADDVDRLGAEPLDVLISHDAPAGVALSSSWRLSAQDQVRTDHVRALIAQAMMATSPRLVVHGHWHHGYESELTWIDRATTDRIGELTWSSARVVGLGCDGDTERGWIVLDLPTLELSWPALGE